MTNEKNRTNFEFFEERLYDLLNKHNLTQTKLSSKLKLPPSTISKCLNEKRIPSAKILIMIADYFDVSIDYLLGRTPYETPEIAAHSLAAELNLSSDGLSGLISNLKDFQDMAGIVSHKDAERYMNEFLKSPVLTLLMFSGLLICCKNKKTAIKTVLLDQNIIAGIGNIYADEILFLCKLNPQKRFNIPILHGLFCKNKISEEEALKKIEERKNQ